MVTKAKTAAPVQAQQIVNAQQSDGVLTVGLDEGYGAVKVVIPNRPALIFPSVYGRAHKLNEFKSKSIATKKNDDGELTYLGDQLSDDDGDWFIGRLAQSQLKTAEQLVLRGRSANEQDIGNAARVRLMKAAIGKLLVGRKNGEAIHIRIATGLPVSHMDGAADLKTALIGLHHIHTDAADFVANIIEVIVMPQPYGTLYAQQLTPAGDVDPCFTAIRSGVVDVGTFSIDVALDDDGEFIGGESDSVEGGVHLAQQRLIAMISRKYNDTPSLAEVDEMIRTKCMRVQGKVVPIAAEVDEALQPIRDSTIALINRLWQNARQVDVIYVTGGGASIVGAAVKAANYDQAVLVENSQTANARGYLSYALFKDKA